MKKLSILFLAAILSISLSACEKNEAVRSLDRVQLVNESVEEGAAEVNKVPEAAILAPYTNNE